ncbi:peptidoglycan-binding domain-containing protein [Phaeobacter gallaeciensis]|uniref:peptidoglycan-binding domain-containing protein n=1 Tax=Phaeobacter gallaeciensis TaxID=60890 RepID=UPI00237F91A9|nr:peptidoglycan-binding domain-containing protein [Phaeobacter gallaeciensis]MDE4061167.1 peptidoglycan-binding domain-containing protein [Phaeobacter gallaeciensis]MDE4124186.1 peptidoglycan-binding domain-containing protein [Phaeobacter gallaeciensis]MDE4128958.1 peptidoglycan-binding domain-containing protein [Phaeobacter gallaeciensis]
MIRKTVIQSAAAALLSTTMLVSGPALADITSEIAAIQGEIASLEEEISNMANPDSLFGVLKQARLDATALTLALLTNQKLADEGAGTIEVIVPAVQPHPEKSAQLLEEYMKQMKVIDAVQDEVAQYSGGLVQAMAISRLETEKLTLAQIRAAWMQAEYGIALPANVSGSVRSSASDIGNSNPSNDDGDETKVAWADPTHPDIDYDQSIFRQLDNEGFEVVGWWGLKKYQAEVDDSPAVFAINVNAFTEGYGDDPSLKIGCQEGTASVVFDTDDYILTDSRANSISVTYRIDDSEAQTGRWSKLSGSKGAGLFNADGEAFLRKLYGSKKTFFRLRERDGEIHSMSLNMAGTDVVIDAAAAACGFSTLELTRDDYKAIQTMLNAGGFNAGDPDGVWGNGSKKALRKFQEANGLSATGAPDRKTLKAMGLDL